MRLDNAIICPVISLARITGRQSAPEILADIRDIFLRHARPQQDRISFHIVTTMGLYANNSDNDRWKMRDKVLRFERRLREEAQTVFARDTVITPADIQVTDWDVLLGQPGALGKLRRAMGILRNEYQRDTPYRAALKAEIAQPVHQSADKAEDFFHEEYAFEHLLEYRDIKLGDNADTRPLYICYPGSVGGALDPALQCLRKGKQIWENLTFEVDTTNRQNPVIKDFAHPLPGLA